MTSLTAHQELVIAAWCGAAVLACIGLYILTPDIIAWIGSGFSKLAGRRERILQEREARRG